MMTIVNKDVFSTDGVHHVHIHKIEKWSVLVDSKVGEVGGTRLRRRVNNLGLGRAETAGGLESMGDSDKGGFSESKHERVGLES